MIDLVFIPGHLCGAWLYQPQWDALEGRARLHLADVTRDDTIEAMARRMLAETPSRAMLVGLSMGGMVAMEAMAAAPDRVVGAVLMSTDPAAARPKEKAWRAGEIAGLQATGVTEYAARFSAKFFGHDDAVAERLGPAVREAAGAVPEAVALAQARALDARRDMIPLIQGFAAPVEVVVGAEDRVCPPRLHPPVAEACADARLTELAGVGHLASLEAPDAVTARIEALIARLA